jgi:hypothetical protein
MKKQRLYLHRISAKLKREKLAWPGLKAKDHLSRVVSRAVKDAKESREKEEWAENQIARVLDFVGPQHAVKLIFLETRRRRSLTPKSRRLFSGFLRRWRILNRGN